MTEKLDNIIANLQGRNYKVIIRNDGIANIHSVIIMKYFPYKNFFLKNVMQEKQIYYGQFLLPEELEDLEQELSKYL